jgi:DNA invertase Pin-like site-specific DNA recombinase
MIVGYARTSSLAQVAGLEAQERDLRATGCDKIFREQVSSVAEREQLEAALDYVREGDSFAVTKIDRFGAVRWRPAGDRGTAGSQEGFPSGFCRSRAAKPSTRALAPAA